MSAIVDRLRERIAFWSRSSVACLKAAVYAKNCIGGVGRETVSEPPSLSGRVDKSMQAINFSFITRKFQIWRYTVSHGQLLIRSTKSDSVSTRVDVLFKGVLSINLPTLFNGLTVEELRSAEAGDPKISLGAWNPLNMQVYEVSGSNYRGYVVAAAVFWAEDSGEYYSPSQFEASLDLHATDEPPPVIRSGP